MPYYRLYTLSPANGHIDRVEEFEAADDVAAVALVRERDHKVAVELWQESRKILHLAAPDNIARPGAPPGQRSALGA